MPHMQIVEPWETILLGARVRICCINEWNSGLWTNVTIFKWVWEPFACYDLTLAWAS